MRKKLENLDDVSVKLRKTEEELRNLRTDVKRTMVRSVFITLIATVIIIYLLHHL